MGPVTQESKDASNNDSDDLDDLDEDSSRQPLKTTFELNDTLYAEAELEDTDAVHLWLGVRLQDSNAQT
jgi:hypothetical protein